MTSTASFAADWFAPLVLGLVEGLTEFLPISSTGHLLLAQQVVARQSDAFNILIQVGAVLAVLVAFSSRITALVATRHTADTKQYVGELGLSFVLTAIGGLLLKHFDAKLPESPVPVAVATLVGGVLFLLVEWRLKALPAPVGTNAPQALGYKVALGMAAGQLVAAAFPGASRSGTTILFALLLGASRVQATEFSFLLGLPTILAAGLVSLRGLVADGSLQEPIGPLLLASGVSFVTAAVTVKWLLRYVRSHSFVGFGVYRVALGLLLLWAMR